MNEELDLGNGSPVTGLVRKLKRPPPRLVTLVEAGAPVPTPPRVPYREGVGSVELRACRGCPASVFGGFSESFWDGGAAPNGPGDLNVTSLSDP